MKRLISPIGSVLLALSIGVISATAAPTVESYLQKSETVLKDIDAAENAGNITKEEAVYFKKEQGKISEKEVDLKSKNNGRLKPNDEKKLTNQLAELDKKVHKNSHMKADNTGKNVGDREKTAVTAETQSNAKGDISVTASIRRWLMHEKNLSSDGKNIKIVTVNGDVTLRGPVDSEAEKEKIASGVKSCTGVSKVTDELQVVPKKK